MKMFFIVATVLLLVSLILIIPSIIYENRHEDGVFLWVIVELALIALLLALFGWI
jgi:hypothetical protein